MAQGGPLRRRVASARRYRAADRAEICVDGGRRRPLELAKLGEHLVRRDDVRGRDAAAAAPPPPPRSCDGSRNEKRRQTAIASASDLGAGDDRSSGVDDAIRADPLAHTETALERDERLRMVDVEPVEMRTILPPQVEQVLEASVATNAVRAPLRSSSAFVATVVPCVKRSTSQPRRSARAARPRRRNPPARAPSAPSPSAARRREQDGVGERAADVDPMNAIQVELLKRYRAGDADAFRPMLRSIAGIAAALRNTG